MTAGAPTLRRFMAEIYDFPIPRDPAVAEFAFAVANFIKSQHEVNVANRASIEALSDWLHATNRRLDAVQGLLYPDCPETTPPDGK